MHGHIDLSPISIALILDPTHNTGDTAVLYIVQITWVLVWKLHYQCHRIIIIVGKGLMCPPLDSASLSLVNILNRYEVIPRNIVFLLTSLSCVESSTCSHNQTSIQQTGISL